MKLSVMLALAVVAAACVVDRKLPVYRPDLMRELTTESDKLVEVVANENLPDHEPREVAANVVANALLGSGLFLAEDAEELGATIAPELGAMEPYEQVRVVGWSEDGPRFYYVFITGGRLRVIYYQRGSEISRHDAVIPAPIVAIVAPSAVDAGVGPAPDADAATVPAATPIDAGGRSTGSTGPARVAHRRRPATPRPPPISESEARTKISELDAALSAGLITKREHTDKRKDILARL